MSQASMALAVTEQFEKAVAHALKPLNARVTALEERNEKLEKDLLALRRAAAAIVSRAG